MLEEEKLDQLTEKLDVLEDIRETIWGGLINDNEHTYLAIRRAVLGTEHGPDWRKEAFYTIYAAIDTLKQAASIITKEG